jgi:hypothetical protein
MFQLFNLNSPVKNSIILFILLVVILLILKPKLLNREYTNSYNKCYLPILIIVISMFSYYFFSVISLFIGD